MDKQNVVYPDNGILSTLKKEENSDRCYNTNEHWGPHANWNMPVTQKQILYDSTYMKYLE